MSDKYQDSIVAVRGIEVGHAQNDAALTGCTVILCRKGAVAGVDVRGSAPVRAKRICSIRSISCKKSMPLYWQAALPLDWMRPAV